MILETNILLREGQWYFCIIGSRMDNQGSWACGWLIMSAFPNTTCRILWNRNMFLHLDPIPLEQIHHVSLKGFRKQVATR